MKLYCMMSSRRIYDIIHVQICRKLTVNSECLCKLWPLDDNDVSVNVHHLQPVDHSGRGCDNRGVCAYVGAGNIWEISVPSSSILLWSKNSLKKKYFKNPGKFQRKSKWRICRFIHPWVKKRSTIILRITNQILPNSKAQTSYGQNCFLFLYVSCTFIQHQEIICQNTAYFRNIYIYTA